jgi:hypothetical protein
VRRNRTSPKTSSPPFSVTVKGWLRKADTAARIRRGQHIVQPVDRAGLFAEAIRNLDDWRATDFVDVSRALRRFVGGHLAHDPQPPPVAERVTRENGLAGFARPGDARPGVTP